MSPAAADATGRPGEPGRPELTSRSGRPERWPVDERLMATGTVLDSIVEARTAARSSKEPLKRSGSVSTETAAAQGV